MLSSQLPPTSRRWLLAPLALVVLVLSGCASVNSSLSSMSTLGGVLSPYRIDIQQGNVVVRQQVQALQPGMTREAVRDILGTPLVASAFHAERWDYVFTLRRQGQEPQQRRVTVFFSGDLLQRVQADELPSEEEFVATLDRQQRSSGRTPVLAATEEQIKAFQARYNTGTRAEPAAPAAATQPTRFPPLESR